ncbi:MAG: glutamate dehydrogenase, partial [Sphaerochaetaceae bacterium]|nr:glutamate dehydrogenase [Sphaerochaetaceae bacterium]
REVEYQTSTFVAGEENPLWLIPADLAFPCATQNEINEKDAINLVNNKIILVAEGANMPTTLTAQQRLKENGVLLIPAKAANAGGVAVSGLEMAQNSSRIRWSSEKVDKELQKIMNNIYLNISNVAERYSEKNNFVDGANIAAFIRVSEAMISQGYV